MASKFDLDKILDKHFGSGYDSRNGTCNPEFIKKICIDFAKSCVPEKKINIRNENCYDVGIDDGFDNCIDEINKNIEEESK